MPATEETVTLYRDTVNNRLLTVSVHWLEYAEPDLCFRTAWSNLAMIHQWLFDYSLYLLKDPKIIRANGRFSPRPTFDGSAPPRWGGRITLSGFGYPHNKALCTNLRRHAPQLSKYMPV